MSTINVDTDINQDWVDVNSSPWTILDGITVTLTSNLKLNATDYFVMNNNTTIDGNGYKVYRPLGAYALSKPFGNLIKGIVIKNVGVILSKNGTTLSDREGAIYSSYVFPGTFANCEVSIYRCYSIGDINGYLTSGIIGYFGSGGVYYIYDCFHIGVVNESFNSTAAGIVGAYAGKNSGVCFIMNCYNIGVVTNGAAIIGPFPGDTNGKVYLINCYYTDGSFVYNPAIGTSQTYFGYNKLYNGSNWNDTSAKNSLYTNISGGTELYDYRINDANNYWNKIRGSSTTPIQSDLTDFTNYLNGTGQTSPYYSYFQFSLTNEAFGIQHFNITPPYVIDNYVVATDEPAITAVITSNMSINQTWVNLNKSPWRINENIVVILNSNITISKLDYFIMQNNSEINGKGYKIYRSSTDSFALCVPYEDSILLTIKHLGVIYFSGGLREESGAILSPYNFYISDYYNNLNIYIRNCYSVLNLTETNTAGIIGSCGEGGIYYIHDCYHIGNISNSTIGGITGANFTRSSGIGIVMNCYNIGTTTSGGSILGANISVNYGYCYIINVYFTSGSMYDGSVQGSDQLYIGYNKMYDGSLWDDSVALTSLYSNESGGSELTSSVITTSGNYTYLYGIGSIPNVTQLNNFISYLNATGQTSPYYSYFKFSTSTNRPWGLTYFTVSPYYSKYYIDAISQPNCFCRGTKITQINNLNRITYIMIENIRKGMTILTPHGINKKVLHIGRFWYSGEQFKHMPYLIPKNSLKNKIPFEDTYASGAHSLMYDKRNAKYIGLDLKVKKERVKERSNGMNLYLIKDFGIPQDFKKVCELKGEKTKHTSSGYYYYHLVIEDNAGYYANGLASESLEMKDFINNFEEVL